MLSHISKLIFDVSTVILLNQQNFPFQCSKIPVLYIHSPRRQIVPACLICYVFRIFTSHVWHGCTPFSPTSIFSPSNRYCLRHYPTKIARDFTAPFTFPSASLVSHFPSPSTCMTSRKHEILERLAIVLMLKSFKVRIADNR